MSDFLQPGVNVSIVNYFFFAIIKFMLAATSKTSRTHLYIAYLFKRLIIVMMPNWRKMASRQRLNVARCSGLQSLKSLQRSQQSEISL